MAWLLANFPLAFQRSRVALEELSPVEQLAGLGVGVGGLGDGVKQEIVAAPESPAVVDVLGVEE